MTSRPGAGVRESLQRRGSGGLQRPQGRRQAPQYGSLNSAYIADCIDPALDEQRRPAEQVLGKSRMQVNTIGKSPAASEGIQSLSNDGARPVPKGKPQIFFNDTGHTTSETALQPPHGQLGNAAAASLPLPPRPGHSRLTEASQLQRILPGGTGVKETASLKAPNNDPPPAACVFPGGKTADVFPWTGNHPEDVLSETLVKIGLSNKPQIMNETNTARPSLWSNLKNKSGLQQLSSLFVQVLEKRQACGRLTAPNTFKPPPRLTLRDSTRETWLNDLANPAVGLRRLSRTIPHGIAGTVLLEHCLNKSIPLPRAVWLAKCVGINEMRSHKRKGQAATVTWVRGWTCSVEQFLEGAIASMGQPGWKPRITYALQLGASLYKDHLLEEDHFLEWILKNVDSCAPERLFVWLLIASLYGDDLTASRRRGRRLAESLMNHADKLYQLDEEVRVAPLLEYLERVLAKLLVTSPSCLFLPKVWETYLPVLQRLASRHPHPQITATLQDLDRRTKVLLQQSKNASSTQDPRRTVLSLLDAVDYAAGVNVDHLAFECMQVMPDARNLIFAVLDWASSFYRDGYHRVYLATRLLRRWSKSGLDIDDAILSYFHSIEPKKSTDPRNVFRIIAELVRSRTFSVGKYLQWLIATGSLNPRPNISSSSPWSVRLIIEIPLTGLPEQVRNLRNTLLRGTPHSTEDEERLLDDAEDTLRYRLSSLFRSGIEQDDLPSLDISHLSSTIKLELALLLRQQIAASVETVGRLPTKGPSVEETGPVCTIGPGDFCVVRSYLEDFGDLSVLADIIGIVATSLDANVLASAADTLHYHLKSFRAIGAFETLFGKLAARYAAIRTVRFPERELLISLTDLSRAAQATGPLMQALVADLSRYDHMPSAAVCSPVSDTTAEVNNGTVIDSDEDIDRILSSGTSMDQQIMARVFDKIWANLEQQCSKNSSPSGYHASWFHRLRTFDEKYFEAILLERLRFLLSSQKAELKHAVVPALVASGCFTLPDLLMVARDCVNKRKTSSQEEALQISLDVLDVILPSSQLSDLCQAQEAYRYRLEQRKFCHEPGDHILRFLGETLEFGAMVLTQASQSRLERMLSSDQVRAIVKHFALKNAQSLCDHLGIGSSSYSDSTFSCLRSLLDSLLDPSHSLGLSQKSTVEKVKTIVEAADPLSLPFCQIQIRLLFSMNVGIVDTTSGALLEAIKVAVEKNQSPWFELVAGLDNGLINKIRDHAERELLGASSFLTSPATLDPRKLLEDDSGFIQKYLTVINSTASMAFDNDVAPLFASIVERLKGVADILGKLSEMPKQNVETGHMSSLVSSLCQRLDVLLRLAVVRSSMALQKIPTQHQGALLWNLRRLMTHPALAPYPLVTQLIFDVALVLHDSISDDVRHHLARQDAAKPSDDKRCSFLFGSSPSHDGWLALAKPVNPPPTPQATSSQQPQAHAASNQNSPQQIQNKQPQNANPAALQRSLSQQHQQQLQAQSQNANRMYPQYPQHPQAQNRMYPQFQQMGSNNAGQQQNQQIQQLQRMQQMQALAQQQQQQRNMQPSPVQMQNRQMPSTPQPQQPGAQANKNVSAAKQEPPEMKMMPFELNHWECLPESGGNPNANETAVNLKLFGARRV